MKRLGLLVAGVLLSALALADTKISALPAGTTLAGTEAIPAVQSAATVKTTPAAIDTYVKGSAVVTAVVAGGTNLAAAADDNVMVGNGTTWQTKALTSCSAASSAVTYNTTTNAWGCNTISGGATQTTGTFTATYDQGFTTSPTQTWSWVLTGSTATVRMTSALTGTSNQTFIQATGALPANLRPVERIFAQVGQAVNSGSTDAAMGCIGLYPNGNITYDRSSTTVCGSAWTNTGTKGINVSPTVNIPSSFSYPLN